MNARTAVVRQQAVAASQATTKVLIAAHGHPEIAAGGGEIAAFQVFEALRQRPDCQAWFLGCDPGRKLQRSGVVLSQPWSADEFIYAPDEFDWFKMGNRDLRLPAEIEALLLRLDPGIVHFHHYVHFGVELLACVRRTLPACRIVLTLHEYLAICHHYGQMVTTGHRALCYRSSPERCHKCFPEVPAPDFFLRSRYIMRFFDLVDAFIAPSRFLADRYIAWGLPATKITVLDNLPAQGTTGAKAVELGSDGVIRIGFFGQISILKGVLVLLDAARHLLAEGVLNMSFEIYGDYRDQPEELRRECVARLETAGANVRFCGPYDKSQVNGLMQSVHAVVVPSVWWENSPVVIQEALSNRRPVICSGIGGMAEKVRDGVDGFHFPPGNSLALAGLLRNLARDPEPLLRIAAGLPGVVPNAPAIEDFLNIYQGNSGEVGPGSAAGQDAPVRKPAASAIKRNTARRRMVRS